MNVVSLTEKDIVWSFTQPPKLKLGLYVYETIDPTPCYPHDLAEVHAAVERLRGLFDIPTELYVSHFEGEGRTNGWASTRVDYGTYDEKAQRYAGRSYYVFLNGKRTPIHPAMTRYLVPHEYGHNVQSWLEHHWGLKEDALRDTYRRVRGTPEQPYYGPGTWHLMPGEHFANDFRLILAKAEEEYWPHPGVERPGPELREWWEAVLADPSKDRYDDLCALAGVELKEET